MFWYYYITTGMLMSILCLIYYNKIIDRFPLASFFGKTGFILINFFFGFLNIPICIPILIHTWFLTYRIKTIEKQNEKLKKEIEKIKNQI